MKRILLVISVFIVASVLPYSCETFESANMQVCDVENPLEDLPWLKDIKLAIQLNMSPAGSQIIQYSYKGEYVFWVDVCFQCPDGVIAVYNCAGEVICEFGGIDGRNTCIDFETEATDSTNLFISIQNNTN